MNPRKQRFCTEFIVDLNGTEAAVRAGYSRKSAHVQASRLLDDPKVKARIAELQAELAKRTGITVEKVLAEYSKLAFSNMADYIQVRENGIAFLDLSKLTRDQAAAISHFDVDEDTVLGDEDEENEERQAVVTRKVKIKLADKKGALDSIAKHLGMFLDRESSPDKGAAKFAGTMEELLALYRRLTAKVSHA